MITERELIAILKSHDIDPPGQKILDGTYRCPTRKWLYTTFPSALASTFSDVGFRYAAESQDCDDYALFAVSYARLLHANTKRGQSPGIAFGLYIYVRAAQFDRHAINISLVKEKGEYHPVFFEPQLGKIVELEKSERQSCEFYLF